MKTMTFLAIGAFTVAVQASLGHAVQTVAYPAKAIRLIVPLTAGGPTDILARLIAQPLGDRLGQQAIVDNRPGAGGNIGAELVAKSAPDGYTLFMGTSGPLSINISIYRDLAYDPVRDFAPIILAASAPFAVVVHPSLPANDIRQLIALVKARPRALNYGAVPGTAAHLATESFRSMAGLDMVFVPYKGAAQANTDLIAGQIQLSFASTPGAVPLVKSGRLKPLAVTSSRRVDKLPEVPTVAESGVRGYEASVWYGVVAPARTPQEIIVRLNQEIARILDERGSRERMAANDFAVASASSPDQFGTLIKREIEKWGKVVRATGARAE